MKIIDTFLLFFILLQGVLGQYDQSRINEAKNTFEDVKEICNKDNGELWGKNLWCPLLVINRETRFIIANEPDNDNLLIENSGVYCGYYPNEKIISNFTTDFGGKSWTMVTYLPENEFEKNSLFIHEMFHRLQPELGLSSCFGYDNSHMDKMQARILLKLEWAALEDAIKQIGKTRINSIRNALIFRYYRREIFQGCDTMENKFELHEGLAEYTANKLCTNNNNEFKNRLLAKKERYWQKEKLVRIFGYYSGFLYAYLLDQSDFNWRNNLKNSDDLGKIIQHAYNIEMPFEIETIFNKIKENYSFSNICDFEQQLKIRKDSILKKYYKIFTKDTVLILNLNNPHIGFNPNTLQPFDTLGTVYPYIIITDTWGRLDVNEGGCLLSKDWSKATIPANNIIMNNSIIKDSLWKLNLKDDWGLEKKNSNYFLLKKTKKYFNN